MLYAQMATYTCIINTHRYVTNITYNMSHPAGSLWLVWIFVSSVESICMCILGYKILNFLIPAIFLFMLHKIENILTAAAKAKQWLISKSDLQNRSIANFQLGMSKT